MNPPIAPCEGRVSNPFGERGPYTNAWKYHLGIDLAVPVGTPLLAAGPGIIEATGHDPPGLGNYVVIGHPAGYRTLYAHLSAVAVERGAVVTAGQWLGLSGNTGMSTGPHLHFECWVQCAGLAVPDSTPYSLTRNDPTALPADPAPIWEGRWPTWKAGRNTWMAPR